MIVVDASVAVMWFLAGPLSPQARKVLGSEETLAAPESIHLEVAAALSRALRARRISAADCERALSRVLRESVVTLPWLEWVQPAFDLAAAHGGTVYDGLYVVCARSQRASLVTADVEMAAVARKAKVAVSLLSEHPAQGRPRSFGG